MKNPVKTSYEQGRKSVICIGESPPSPENRMSWHSEKETWMSLGRLTLLHTLKTVGRFDT